MKAKGEYYTCAACGLKYVEKKWADKCHAWCEEHASCNILIIKHAMK